MKAIQIKVEEYLQYTLGFSQVLLSNDNEIFWVIIEIFAQFQRIAIIFMPDIINDMLFLGYVSSYPTILVIAEIMLPTTLLIKYMDDVWIVFFYVWLTSILYFPLLINMWHMSCERKEFENMRYRSENSQDSLEYSINLLNRSYNQHNFMEHFIQKQLMGNNNGDWADSERRFQARILNIFPHVLALPLTYWNLMVLVLIIRGVITTYIPLIVFLNILSESATSMLWFLSMIVQRTYSIRDNNHLRLKQSFWFNISQFFKLIPIIGQMFYLAVNQDQNIQNTPIYFFVILSILFLQSGDLIDFFISKPYILEYKRIISLILLPFCILFTLCVITNQNETNLLSICLISIPLISRLLIQIMDCELNDILQNLLFKEKRKKELVQQFTNSRYIITEEAAFVIEKEIHQQRQIQIEYVQKNDFCYFIHYLRLVELMKLEQQQTLERGASELLPIRSKFLITIIILLESHSAQCVSVYCYCKGFRGEKRAILENIFHTKKTKIYTDIFIQNLLIQVELIRRYLRYQAKMIFEIEKNKQNPSLTIVTQLLHYLCDSDECYQNLQLIMEFKTKHKIENNFQQDIAFTYVQSYSQYCVLYRMQDNTKSHEIEATLQYKDYRVTEIRRDKIIRLILQNLQEKIQFLTNLQETTSTYENYEKLILAYAEKKCETEKEIQKFHQFSSSRTSLLLMMLFYLEIENNYDKFLKCKTQLKTRSIKFFESTNQYDSVVAQTVCYLKVNLARHAKKGKISRGEIIQFSNNAPEFFGYTQREFLNDILTIHKLVTEDLAVFHDQLIEILLLTNKPKIFRKRRPLLTIRKDKSLMYCEMFVDFCFNIKEEEFPIYCFMKDLSSSSRHENVKGHFVINSEFFIEGVSKQALNLLKIDDPMRFYQQDIGLYINNFQRYVDRLNLKLNEYLLAEEEKKKNLSCSTEINLRAQYELLSRFTVSAEGLLLKLKIDDSTYFYSLDCDITLSCGDIHGRLYKAFQLQINKINMVETRGSVLQINDNVLSQLDILSSILPSVENEVNSDHNMDVDKYQFPQAYDIPELPKLVKNMSESLKMDVNAIMRMSHLSHSVQKRNQVQQQKFFSSTIKRKSIKADETQTNKNTKQQMDFYVTTNSSQQNPNNQNNLYSKSSQYSKFARKSYTPNLINSIAIVDIMSILFMLTITLFQFNNLYDVVNKNQNIIDILQAFVTTDYSQNTLLALSIQQNHHSQYLNILQQNLDENVQQSLGTYKQYSSNSLVRQTLSYIYVFYYDSYNDKDVLANAFSEQFYVNLMGSLLISSNNKQLFNDALSNLVYQYKTHYLTFQQLTSQFQDQQQYYLQSLIDTQQLILIVSALGSILFIFLYSFTYIQLFKLQNKIIRCTEQITYKSLESEQIRCQNILTIYPHYWDLDIYQYQFQLKDKLQQAVSLDFLKKSTRRKSFSVLHSQANGEQLIMQNEYKKAIQMLDSCSYFKAIFIVISILGLIINIVYFVTIYSINIDQLTKFKTQVQLFNDQIVYTEYFSQMMLCDLVIQYREQLTLEFGIIDEIFTFYLNLLISTYDEIEVLGSKLAYQTDSYQFDLLVKLNINLCTLINQTLCPTIINGKLQSGILAGSQYFSQLVRENLNYNFSSQNLTKLDELSVLAVDFINSGFQIIIDENKILLKQEFSELYNNRAIFFAIFVVCLFIYWFISMIIIQSHLRRRFYKIRQLAFLLPPQSLYAEDSFSKTLSYVEKVYNNILQ